MARVKEPIDELEDFQARSPRRIRRKIIEVAVALTRSRGDFDEARIALRDEILEAMQFADLLGRRRLLLEADSIKAGEPGREQEAAIRRIANSGIRITRLAGGGRRSFIPVQRQGGLEAAFGAEGPPFSEAIANLVAREPRLAASADQVAEFYRTSNAFAAVGAPELEIAAKVQREIGVALEAGLDTDAATKAIEAVTDWSKWYAETVFRTNTTTAYSAGRWKMASDPIVAEVIPAMRYDAVGDGDTRPNHLAADGLIAGITDPIWEKFSPPLGYNCRCTIALVDRFELEALGLLDAQGNVTRSEPSGFSAAGPDSDRFGRGRPDRRLYGF